MKGWEKTGQFRMVSLPAGIGVLLIVVLAVVVLDDESKQSRIIEAQTGLLDVKNELDSLERRLLMTRQDELIFLGGEFQKRSRIAIETDLLKLIGVAQNLAERVKDPEIQEHMSLISRVLKRYHASAEESFDAREELGRPDRAGLLHALSKLDK